MRPLPQRPFAAVLAPVAGLSPGEDAHMDAIAECVTTIAQASGFKVYNTRLDDVCSEGTGGPGRERRLAAELRCRVAASAAAVVIDLLPARGIGALVELARSHGTDVRLIHPAPRSTSKLFGSYFPDAESWIGPEALAADPNPLALWLTELRGYYDANGRLVPAAIAALPPERRRHLEAREEIAVARAALGRELQAYRESEGRTSVEMASYFLGMTPEEYLATEQGLLPLTDTQLLQITALTSVVRGASRAQQHLRDRVVRFLAEHRYPADHLEPFLGAVRGERGLDASVESTRLGALYRLWVRERGG